MGARTVDRAVVARRRPGRRDGGARARPADLHRLRGARHERPGARDGTGRRPRGHDPPGDGRARDRRRRGDPRRPGAMRAARRARRRGHLRGRDHGGEALAHTARRQHAAGHRAGSDPGPGGPAVPPDPGGRGGRRAAVRRHLDAGSRTGVHVPRDAGPQLLRGRGRGVRPLAARAARVARDRSHDGGAGMSASRTAQRTVQVDLEYAPPLTRAKLLEDRWTSWLWPALPGLTGEARRRWSSAGGWSPPGTVLLSRFVDLETMEYAVTLGDPPEPRFVHDFSLGVVQRWEVPGSRQLIAEGDELRLADVNVEVEIRDEDDDAHDGPVCASSAGSSRRGSS